MLLVDSRVRHIRVWRHAERTFPIFHFLRASSGRFPIVYRRATIVGGRPRPKDSSGRKCTRSPALCDRPTRRRAQGACSHAPCREVSASRCRTPLAPYGRGGIPISKQAGTNATGTSAKESANGHQGQYMRAVHQRGVPAHDMLRSVGPGSARHPLDKRTFLQPACDGRGEIGSRAKAKGVSLRNAPATQSSCRDLVSRPPQFGVSKLDERGREFWRHDDDDKRIGRRTRCIQRRRR
mmetsp:Transcript_30929/g.90798  ORF Transcript_30929/g.90798 Transcript_30929/m.90798 type:complete len:237 (+) Transcript_30929:1562-2272(+)